MARWAGGYKRSMLAMLPLVLAACTPSALDTADTADEPDTIPSSSSTYLQPEVVGFEFVGGWDEHQDALVGWSYNGLSYDPYIRIILADSEYFKGNPDADSYYTHFCEVLANLDGGSAPLEARQHEDGATATLRASFVGTLSVYGYGDGQCDNFDPDVWIGGEPRWTLDGIPFGIGLGPHTDFLDSAWSEQVIEQYGDYMIGAWFAYSRPADGGGTEFVAHDWTTALLWQRDAISGELLVDDDARPIGQSVNDPVLSGWVSSYAWFYDDVDNFLDIQPSVED